MSRSLKRGVTMMWLTTHSLNNSLSLVDYMSIYGTGGVNILSESAVFALVCFRQRRRVSGKPAKERFLSRLRV